MATKTKTRKTEQAETKPQILNVAFVWDMSGSMASIQQATREGTGSYLADLVKEENALVEKHGEDVYTRLSVTAFDTAFEQWIVDEQIALVNVPELLARYQPRGWTALYDAIANTITTIDTQLKGKRKDERVLVVIMTDGLENSSIEYGGPGGRQRIFDLVKAYEAKGNWTFVYLGANVDAYAEANAIGIPSGNAAFYTASAGSVAKGSSSLSPMTSSLRSADADNTLTAFADAGQSQDYRDEDDK